MDTHQTAQIEHVNDLTPRINAPIDHVGVPPVGPRRYPEAVRINVAAEIAGVCRRTMYNWIARGWVTRKFTPSGATLVVVSSLTLDERPADRGTLQPPNAARKSPASVGVA